MTGCCPLSNTDNCISAVWVCFVKETKLSIFCQLGKIFENTDVRYKIDSGSVARGIQSGRLGPDCHRLRTSHWIQAACSELNWTMEDPPQEGQKEGKKKKARKIAKRKLKKRSDSTGVALVTAMVRDMKPPSNAEDEGVVASLGVPAIVVGETRSQPGSRFVCLFRFVCMFVLLGEAVPWMAPSYWQNLLEGTPRQWWWLFLRRLCSLRMAPTSGLVLVSIQLY